MKNPPRPHSRVPSVVWACVLGRDAHGLRAWNMLFWLHTRAVENLEQCEGLAREMQRAYVVSRRGAIAHLLN